MRHSILIVAAATLAALLVPAAGAFAQGESGAHCLIIPPSARANGMGQTYVAVSDDATSSWWNPAGLAFIDKAVDIMYSQLVPELASDVKYAYFGGATKIQGLGTVGASLIYLGYGDWEARDPNNNYLGQYSSWEAAPNLSGAVEVVKGLGVGVSLKFVYIDLAPPEATVERQAGRGHSIAVDAGALYKVPDFAIGGFTVSRLNLGLCFSNLGPSITFINTDQAASLPRNARFGFSYVPYKSEVGAFLVAAEVNRPLVEFERSNTYHFGAEFNYIDLIAVRAGYMHDKDGNIMDPTYGLGFSLKRVRLDWASVPQAKELGRVQRWSLGVSF